MRVDAVDHDMLAFGVKKGMFLTVPQLKKIYQERKWPYPDRSGPILEIISGLDPENAEAAKGVRKVCWDKLSAKREIINRKNKDGEWRGGWQKQNFTPTELRELLPPTGDTVVWIKRLPQSSTYTGFYDRCLDTQCYRSIFPLFPIQALVLITPYLVVPSFFTMVTFTNILGIPGLWIVSNIFTHSDSEAGVQKYKSCKWAGTRNQMEEHEACDVVVQSLWEMHLLNEKNSKDAELRQSGCDCFGLFWRAVNQKP